jgi:hypothetical protein
MILLILFYVAVVILAGMLIAFGFSFYLKSRQISAPENQRYLTEPPEFRPLFAPGEEELRALENEEKARAAESARAGAADVLRQKAETAQRYFAGWQNTPDKRTIGTALQLAAESESAKTFSEISENVIKTWQDKKIAGLAAADLADLLDSHFRTLPQQEMASGALFWLKQEIAALRREVKN